MSQLVYTIEHAACCHKLPAASSAPLVRVVARADSLEDVRIRAHICTANGLAAGRLAEHEHVHGGEDACGAAGDEGDSHADQHRVHLLDALGCEAEEVEEGDEGVIELGGGGQGGQTLVPVESHQNIHSTHTDSVIGLSMRTDCKVGERRVS